MEQNPLREFEPLKKLLQHIPTKVMKGFRAYTLDLTSIDVLGDFIAIGCNAGVVFLYERSTLKLQKLESEVCIPKIIPV